MKQFLLYGHGGAYNHGAEAIIKCTAEMIRGLYPDSKIILSTHFIDQDLEYDLPVDEYCIRDSYYLELDKNSPIKGLYDGMIYKSTLDKITKDTICLSVGGDNYCYPNWQKWKVIHESVLKRGAQSILWSSSIEPSMINDEMLSVLNSHHLIVARESITYSALKDKGLDNVVLYPDIAFLLDPMEYRLPEKIIKENTVAINISPLITRKEETEGIVLRNTLLLIESIIRNTDMNIVLIPHVLISVDNDLTILEEIYNRIDNRERVCFLNSNLSVAEYKYIISNCRFGVFSRTHASIAAYSSCVPTMVLGYSVKSQGIAKDLGVEDFVLPVQSVNHDHCMLSMFDKLLENEQNVRQNLKNRMHAYIERARSLSEVLK